MEKKVMSLQLHREYDETNSINSTKLSLKSNPFCVTLYVKICRKIFRLDKKHKLICSLFPGWFDRYDPTHVERAAAASWADRDRAQSVPAGQRGSICSAVGQSTD